MKFEKARKEFVRALTGHLVHVEGTDEHDDDIEVNYPSEEVLVVLGTVNDPMDPQALNVLRDELPEDEYPSPGPGPLTWAQGVRFLREDAEKGLSVLREMHPDSFEAQDADAGTLLLAEFIRVITRSRIVVWTRPGEGEEERFEAAIDTGTSGSRGDLEIMVRPFPKVLRGGRATRPFAQVSWFGEDDAVVAEMETDIDAELYAEVEEAWRASGSENMQVAVIRRGAAPTMRPYGPANEDDPTGADQLTKK